MTLKASLVQKIGNAIKEVARNKGSTWWYTPHMAAASRSIAERIPLVDLVLEVRDARIPLSSKCELIKNLSPSSRRIIILNKTDLANHIQLKEWLKYFEQQKCLVFGVNSHNKDKIKELLNFLRARVRELPKTGHGDKTITLMLVGIPNVGKSALANSLHQIGRISAAEKGRLKHAVVSPDPGETKNISGLKIASHPSIYVLDAPGVLPADILDAEVCSNLALTGAIKDCLVGEVELAEYFLSIFNLSDEYKKWAKLSLSGADDSSELERRQKRQYLTDHTQDFIVNKVRRMLFEVVSSFNCNLEDEEIMLQLIKAEFAVLRDAFNLPPDSDDYVRKVAAKLLNLYRTGRLGHYTLDLVPSNN
ncbi:DAR GTPase 2, mitochondrial [Nicotiana sylvestris]|uniref:Mitochondrial ribosome-associated GTPase 1 n=1 Tax=Nicotiana sylvestris TaxID=4096 RepID=A0A1U7XW15_NICSY|nr:PREDICTED: mitochondrial ribosome-associated GTPase 1 [Nicotiana sylvestris]